MRILHVITSLRTGGAEKLMVDLLPRLKEKGHQVDLCVFNGAKTPFYKQLLTENIRIIDFGENNGVYSLGNIFQLRKLIKDYDIIHTHNTSPQLFAAISNLGVKRRLVTTEHNTTNRRRKWKGYAAVDRWMYHQYDRIISISKKTEDNLREYLGECRTSICTINNGIDISKYADVGSSDYLESLASGSRKLIMVAGFRPQKDQDTLMRSLLYLPSDFHLFLVGDGVRGEELQHLAIENGLQERVHFLGVRTDVPNLLHAADYVVMSSHWEGFGLAAVEGMAAGKPILASDVDGLREVVKGAGLLFKVGDAKALSEEILKLEADKDYYNKVAQACQQRARDFDISKMAEGYLKVYNSLQTVAQ